MRNEDLQRRLRAILAADVVGYSRLMRGDEALTFNRLQKLRTDIVQPAIEGHQGRIVKLMGDGLLAEFASVVEAVRCAVSIQKAIEAHETDLPDVDRIRLRIGINLGDIIVAGKDIYGDGVNVAARLEALAQPGGICVSNAVFEQVQDRLEVAFEDLGGQEVKNIDRPIRAWAWLAGGEKASPAQSSSTVSPEIPDKPSVAVLPFDNMSDDPEQEYFSDGITEDIITNLSRIRWFFVIARNSSFVFKGRAVDVRQVSRELGVRYVLEGSVRKAGNRIRITAQLIDAQTSEHIWAERYDRELTDIFAVQDEITENVVGAIEPAILAAEGVRSRSRSEAEHGAWDSVMQAVNALWRLTEKDIVKATELLRRATRDYPDYAPAHSILAYAMLFAAHVGWFQLADIRDEARDLARRAFDLDDQDAWAHLSIGYLNTMNRNTQEAVQSFSRAVSLNPNFAAAYGLRAFARAHAGLTEPALEDAQLALRLSPKDPLNVIYYGAIGLAHFLNKDFDEAIEVTQDIVRTRPDFVGARRLLCTALARAGRIEEARAQLSEIRRLQPNTSAALLRQSLPYPTPELMEDFVGGLVLAGLED